MRCMCGHGAVVSSVFRAPEGPVWRPGPHPERADAQRLCERCGMGFLLGMLGTGANYAPTSVTSPKSVRVTYADLARISDAMMAAMMPGGREGLRELAAEVEEVAKREGRAGALARLGELLGRRRN